MSQIPLAKCDDGHILARAESQDGDAVISWSESIGGYSLSPEKGAKARGRFNEAEKWTTSPLPALAPALQTDNDRALRVAYCRGCNANFDIDMLVLGQVFRTKSSPIIIQPNRN